MGACPMTFSVHGLAVSRGIAIGRAVLVASSRADVAHYFVDADKTPDEIVRIRAARDEVTEEITRLRRVFRQVALQAGDFFRHLVARRTNTHDLVRRFFGVDKVVRDVSATRRHQHRAADGNAARDGEAVD